MLVAQEGPARTIDHQAVQHGLHAGELCRDVLTQGRAVTQGLRLHASDDAIGLLDQLIELLVRVDVECLGQPEHLRTILGTILEMAGPAISP